MTRKVRTFFHLAKIGTKVLFTKGPGVFIRMAKSKFRFYWLRRSRAEITEERNYISNPVFQITTKDFEASKKATGRPHLGPIKTANWFVPYVEHMTFGGAYTIFRFIDYAQAKGVQNRIIIYDRKARDEKMFREKITSAFPGLKDAKLIMFDGLGDKGLSELPASDIAFCTFWTSAYYLLRFNRTKRKYYCAMDYEPLFYPAGAISALAESTYRFPFRGLVNTPGLLMALNKRHGFQGISYVPAVDRRIYHPDVSRKFKRHKPVRIFFYTRPSNLRNAFTLSIEIMKQLIITYGDKIEIITAGADWDESHYNLGGLITNLGLLKSLDEVATLYRSCDIGVVYMLTKHPSYQPFEYMASGMATVTNNNEDNLWLFRHDDNCLIAEPSPAAMTEQIRRLIDDEDLRQKIIKNGLKSVENECEWQLDIVWNDIIHN